MLGGATRSAEAALDNQEKIASLFERLDEDGDGTVRREDLERVLRQSGLQGWTQEQIATLFGPSDTKGDGRIDIDNFTEWLFREEGNRKLLESDFEAKREEEFVLPPYDGPRWMMHDRKTDKVPRTSLRKRPSPEEDYLRAAAVNGEIVEVRVVCGEFANVKLAMTATTGWVRQRYLFPCVEGCPEALAAVSNVDRVELRPTDGRLKDVRKFLRRRNETLSGDEVRAERVWFLKGHFLGPRGLTSGSKDTVFFGCPDEWVERIVANGFQEFLEQQQAGDFGKGLHLTPQSCTAFKETNNFLLICEAALGKDADRLTLQARNPSLDREEVCRNQGYLSVQCHPGRSIDYQGRVVYDASQCKPVYLVKLERTGMLKYKKTFP